jgi:hypothetical protein
MAKSTSRKAVSAPARVKTAVVISPEAFRRLGAACLSENMTQSEIVELLINRSLSGYVVSVRGERINPVAPIDRQSSAVQVNESVAEAA